MDYCAKILLLGKSKAGKSSFINYFIGKKLAKAGAGKPITPDFIPYKVEDGRYPIEIFDTKGLEAKGAHEQLDEIIKEIKKRNNSDDILNWFHTIFYCVSMAEPRFEDFEAMFISRLQKELSQHIHIIITHCDACEKESIANMRRTIRSKITKANGSMKHVEIFEVVCVSKKKRNGQIVKPYGKESVAGRVFDLLLKDMAYKLSSDYAYTLRNACYRVVDDAFADIDSFVDETIKPRMLFDLIMDEKQASERIDRRMDEILGQIDKNIEAIQRQTDEKLKRILYPITRLYSSYIGTVTGSYIVEDAGLDFSDALGSVDASWMGEIGEKEMTARLLPRIDRYMNADGEIAGDGSIGEILGMVIAGIGDLFSLKKNIKKALRDMRWKLIHRSFPSREEIQKKAYKRIVAYIRSKVPPAYSVTADYKRSVEKPQKGQWRDERQRWRSDDRDGRARSDSRSGRWQNSRYK